MLDQKRPRSLRCLRELVRRSLNPLWGKSMRSKRSDKSITLSLVSIRVLLFVNKK